jgi:hypothetical protein
MPWEALSDPTNPFTKTGLSREVWAMLDYLEDAKAATGVDVVVTSTTDHPYLTSSGNVSNHRRPGTGGTGRALDCRVRTRGDNIHAAVAALFEPVHASLHELIYSGSDGAVYVKAGKPSEPYAVSAHRNHVHGAVDLGTFLTYPTPTPPEDPMPSRRSVNDPNAADTGGRKGHWQVTYGSGDIRALNGARDPDPGDWAKFIAFRDASGIAVIDAIYDEATDKLVYTFDDLVEPAGPGKPYTSATFAFRLQPRT